MTVCNFFSNIDQIAIENVLALVMCETRLSGKGASGSYSVQNAESIYSL